MKAGIFPILSIVPLLFACNFSKSANVNFLNGLKTKGDGLSCTEVFISDGEQKLNRNGFTYGETFYVNFSGVNGFEREAGKAFPGLRLYVVSHTGDTILDHADLYADYENGVEIEPLLLNTNLTVADPIHSAAEYILYLKIWDKKGSGSFEAEFGFEVLPNQQIEVISEGLHCREVYLFSLESGSTITDNRARYNEQVYLIFEGVEGFRARDGLAYMGLSMVLRDGNGGIVLNEPDLFGDRGMDPDDVTKQVAANFIVSDTGVESPVTVELVLWDKNSENSIRANTRVSLEK